MIVRRGEIMTDDGRFEVGYERCGRAPGERFLELLVYDDGGSPITWTLRIGSFSLGAWWLPRMRSETR